MAILALHLDTEDRACLFSLSLPQVGSKQLSTNMTVGGNAGELSALHLPVLDSQFWLSRLNC
jgi:hypothetical protein